MDSDCLLATVGQGHSGDTYVGSGLYVGERGLDETGDDQVARQADLLRCTVARNDSKVITVDVFDSSADPRWFLLLCGGGEHVQQSARDCNGSSFAVMLGMECPSLGVESDVCSIPALRIGIDRLWSFASAYQTASQLNWSHPSTPGLDGKP